MSSLKEKIKNKKAILAVIGLGYVGLPLAVEKAKAGFKTIGFDIQDEKVDMVNRGENYIGDVVNEDLKDLVEKGLLRATTDFSEIANADTVCICVPTPLDAHKQPDISYVETTAKTIVPYMHKDMIIILESTTYPGTTEGLLKPILESSGLECGKDFYLAFSPERVDPGNLIYKTKNTPKVVGGVTEECTEIAAMIYESILEAPVHRTTSPSVAEMEKILENTYRNINIGLINELAVLCNKMDINIWEVIDAASTKPYGFTPFYPGPGLGGHCIPLDPYYLSWKAKEYGFHTTMIESSMVINDKMPEYIVERTYKILSKLKKPLNGSKILVLGIAYKNDIDDYRESPAISVIEKLEEENAEVDFFDPYIASYREKENIKLGIEKINEEILPSYDLVVVTTAHSNIDYEMVQRSSKFIFDTKNAFKNVSNTENIELL